MWSMHSHSFCNDAITDSKTAPLRVGVTGVTLAYSGFQALNDYVGTKDLFGRAWRMIKVNVVDALATAAVLVMGEGSEQTPLASAPRRARPRAETRLGMP